MVDFSCGFQRFAPMLTTLGDDSLSADNLLAKLHCNLVIIGQNDINTRAETDESELVASRMLLVLLDVGEDAARNSSSHLLHKYRSALCGLYHHGSVLVQVGRFGRYGAGEFAVEMNHLLNLPTHRHPVDVHVPTRHKNRHLADASLDVALLVKLLDGNNHAIGGAQNLPCGELRNGTVGASEESQHKKQHQT